MILVAFWSSFSCVGKISSVTLSSHCKVSLIPTRSISRHKIVILTIWSIMALWSLNCVSRKLKAANSKGEMNIFFCQTSWWRYTKIGLPTPYLQVKAYINSDLIKPQFLTFQKCVYILSPMFNCHCVHRYLSLTTSEQSFIQQPKT
jgi:hypothetical protein